MNLLALDLSTKTGWSYFENDKLMKVGTFTHKVSNYVSNIKSYKDLPDQYPWNMMSTAKEIAMDCINLVNIFNYPYMVIEHTEGSSHRFSQRTLEFIHFAVLDELARHPHYGWQAGKVKYTLNSDWRRCCKCYISQWPEMVKYNKQISKIKRSVEKTKSGARVAKIDGKVVSPWTAKKLSIYIAKTLYPEMAEQILTDDISDSILLGRAAIKLGIFGE